MQLEAAAGIPKARLKFCKASQGRVAFVSFGDTDQNHDRSILPETYTIRCGTGNRRRTMGIHVASLLKLVPVSLYYNVHNALSYL